MFEVNVSNKGAKSVTEVEFQTFLTSILQTAGTFS
jgi:hypothetical protein